jgi:hypothetical protein
VQYQSGRRPIWATYSGLNACFPFHGQTRGVAMITWPSPGHAAYQSDAMIILFHDMDVTDQLLITVRHERCQHERYTIEKLSRHCGASHGPTSNIMYKLDMSTNTCPACSFSYAPVIVLDDPPPPHPVKPRTFATSGLSNGSPCPGAGADFPWQIPAPCSKIRVQMA